MHFFGRKLTAKLNEIGATVKLFAHGLAPIIGSRSHTRRALRPNHLVGRVFCGMAAFARDELPCRENAWTWNSTFCDPLLQAKWDVVRRADIANAGDAAFDEI